MANNGFISSITTIGFLILLFTLLTGKALDLSKYFSDFQQGFIYGVVITTIVFARRKELKGFLRTILGGKNE